MINKEELDTIKGAYQHAKGSSEKRPTDILELLELLLRKKGSVVLSHDAGGSGMGYYFCAHWSPQGWPYCSNSDLKGAIQTLLKHELDEVDKELAKHRAEMEENRKLLT